MVEARQIEASSLVCVGLDSDFVQIPEFLKKSLDPDEAIFAFNRAIIDMTRDLVCAYKLNWAFYLVHGAKGLQCLYDTIAYIHRTAPTVPVILDAKFGDIGNSNEDYAKTAFDCLGADAVTVSPYVGGLALKPFLEREDKGVIVLARTSNPGAEEFQDRLVTEDGEPQCFYVAKQVANVWNEKGNCGIVVGATRPEELGLIRLLVGDLPILVPGIGAQGGDIKATVGAGMDSNRRGMMINSSRGIIFASDKEDFAAVAREEAIKLRDAINFYCEEVGHEENG